VSSRAKLRCGRRHPIDAKTTALQGQLFQPAPELKLPRLNGGDDDSAPRRRFNIDSDEPSGFHELRGRLVHRDIGARHEGARDAHGGGQNK
jgi:hypothetical protein